ncbi:MAG: cell division protein FtsL [Idiomarinaceae bacterium HL-53]|nr:MAG: cell division protein FtsL [Idiomarinaceae bacterium HL-53]CUS47400.1 cell division protein FtsL [Idiomarinaceae bacterium HL-53]
MIRLPALNLPIHVSLIVALYRDLMRYRGLLIVTLLVMGSALAIVYQTHTYRELMAARETLLKERDELDIEWRHLLVEQNALSEHSRIETLARQQLDMQRPDEAQEVLVPWR